MKGICLIFTSETDDKEVSKKSLLRVFAYLVNFISFLFINYIWLLKSHRNVKIKYESSGFQNKGKFFLFRLLIIRKTNFFRAPNNGPDPANLILCRKGIILNIIDAERLIFLMCCSPVNS